uniref:UDP-glucuronosyltransferase n=1 Tax=Lissorhoptrus oryzophilus TaxID=308863 RepID=A0A2R4FXF4_9CUCU|nr:UDP-glucuronosyltransferase 40AE2 [Lissorhoptrus oryzophilus]
MRLKILLFLLFGLNYVKSYRILGVFPMAAGSHHLLASKLMKGLAEAGHDITMISPYKLKSPPKNGTFTDIVLEELVDDFDERVLNTENQNLYEFENRGVLERIKLVTDLFWKPVNITLHHPKVKKLIESDQKFDAMIMEQFNNEAIKVFSHIYQCPLILLSSMGANAWVNPTVGNPGPVSYIPHILYTGDKDQQQTFYWRLKNLFVYVAEYLYNIYYTHPKHSKLMHEVFPNAPEIYDLRTNASLVLLNSHTSYFSALPVVPNMVEIGGFFIDPPQKLPEDLQKFMDDAKDGVIYFSMGTNLRSKDLPEEKKQMFLKVLGKLKQKVIWKFETDLPGKPSNMMIRNWLPQQDILAHPNTKLFITHGGLLGAAEAIHYGVPMLAIPVFHDQPENAARAERDGYALKIDYRDPNFTEQTFNNMLQALLNDPKYTENVKRRSRLFHDRPMKPMDVARYWVDYVIRHKGADHLKVAGRKMPWYQYFMVDVVLFLAVAFVLVLKVIKFVLVRICCSAKRRNNIKLKEN